jgi:hypothetical protein
MAGMLTVVNPRRKRTRKHRTRKARKVSHSRRRVARAHNPIRRRRRVVRRHRVHNRRRRHHNPALRMGGLMGTLTNGLMVGAGALGTNLATNYANNMLGANKLAGPAKMALKAGIGLVALPMILKFIPGGRKFAGSVAAGAGVAIMFDIYDQFIKASLPAELQDYGYGSLNGYEAGQLNGWTPQQGVAGSPSDPGIYD